MSARQTAASGVFAIIGADSYLAEEALARLLASSVGADADEATEILHGEDASWAAVADAARSRSLFSLKRAVIVRRADEIKGSGEELERYLSDPAPETTLILLAKKPDRRLTVWKRILAKASVVAADPLKGRALRSYVNERIRSRGIPIGEEGIQELLDRVGIDLRRLMGELDKLESYAGRDAKSLGADEVSAVLGKGFASPLYRVADALCEKQSSQVLALVEELLEEGEAPLRILATFHRALRQLQAAADKSRNRGDSRELVVRMGIPPFKLDALTRAARRWTEGELRRALRELFTADRRLKTGAPPRAALAAAVLGCCAPKSERPRA
jgi:DNA polymerase-3 subunit delta